MDGESVNVSVLIHLGVEDRMRSKRWRKVLLMMTPGVCLWLSCPSGVGQFLAPIIQPVIGQVFSDIATEFTSQLLGQTTTP